MFRLFKVVQIILVRMQLAKRNIMMDGCDDENRHALKGIQNGPNMGPCIDYVRKKRKYCADFNSASFMGYLFFPVGF